MHDISRRERRVLADTYARDFAEKLQYHDPRHWASGHTAWTVASTLLAGMFLAFAQFDPSLDVPSELVASASVLVTARSAVRVRCTRRLRRWLNGASDTEIARRTAYVRAVCEIESYDNTFSALRREIAESARHLDDYTRQALEGEADGLVAQAKELTVAALNAGVLVASLGTLPFPYRGSDTHWEARPHVRPGPDRDRAVAYEAAVDQITRRLRYIRSVAEQATSAQAEVAHTDMARTRAVHLPAFDARVAHALATAELTGSSPVDPVGDLADTTRARVAAERIARDL